ncbi:UDP-N-acetylmuramoyl-tripeptide--D-alanyl-D-alanine ligase [Parashewanella spongiae]|uniref:UDP-N-acetylmuramoyl-tripeptide--D-alanyl-D-alanine ligase n=1 Tax=Parashewanella spongiae TaxID=342950 RepID=A0A3A6TEK3_9GAMM|nr:UDP-N-acetylmuramoyl-tripeptide--D-alanyl-D-alanine ligase [Parashewanella spongiae]MCL1078907.1 UDP-N-acetylmuramoyl-tripeptide--D-alanyl-D-alanine ligase [Parashewanella spongiae]RJY11435.1 UDP-N-acetylmuramoyl-tripeptide--D-alanyl-D-alanine ligase [Parashewanella spongiae]
MISLLLSDIAKHLNAELIGANASIESVSTDSRNIGRKGLFIALIGERYDAHDFVPTAIENGVAAVITSKKQDISVPQLLVSDTRVALGSLGELVRKRVTPISIAITGSNGKTSVKEMVSAILSQQHQVLSTAGNFNNDIGLPLTLLRLETQHDFGVFELGANHQGEIDYTSNLVQPQVALVNNIGQAHIEGFGSLEGVAAAKSEIYRHLQPKGVGVYNADDAFAEQLKRACYPHSCLSFGIQLTADVTAQNLTEDELGQYSFKLRYQDKHTDIKLSLNGLHQVYNALAAASICLALDIDIGVIASGLQSVKPVAGRMEPRQLGRVLLIDDSYNANPSSVNAAIDWLSRRHGNNILVLGDLAELGTEGHAMHQSLGVYAKNNNVQQVFTKGQVSQLTSSAFGGTHFQNLDALVLALINEINQHHGPVNMLVKGSRSAAMEHVVQALSNAYEREEWS